MAATAIVAAISRTPPTTHGSNSSSAPWLMEKVCTPDEPETMNTITPCGHKDTLGVKNRPPHWEALKVPVR